MSIYKIDGYVNMTPEDRKYYQEVRKKYYPPEYVPHLRHFKKNKYKKK